MKKILSLVLALSMVLGMFSFSFAGFADVEGTDYAGSVEALVGLGIVNGYTDGTFQPEKVVTRAEMAKMLVIALGQEDAANLAKGSTKFGDVAADHWAAGYINVASQNNVIVGYPDGTFAPEATVTYAEAVTMAVRALGYKNVVESTGTWPTNYMTKAVELDLLDETVGTIGGSTGAARGNVAVILWNMLNRNMWVVTSENQTNGISYGKSAELMLQLKFPQLTVKETTFTSYAIGDEAEVTIRLAGVSKDLTTTANDFYKYAAGEEVKVVYNKDNEILSMASIEEGKKLEGYSNDDDFQDDVEDALPSSKSFTKTANTYSYVTIDKTETKGYLEAKLTATASEYVKEVKSYDSYIKINGNKFTDEEIEDALVIVDGERATLEDVEEGMVLTTISSKKFYIASSETVEGTLTKVAGDSAPLTLTVEGEKYQSLVTVAYTELDKEYSKQKSLNLTSSTDGAKVKGEEARLFTNAIGEVVRIEFDTIDDEAATSDLYVMMTRVYDVTVKGETTYYVDLENAAGEKEDCVIADAYDATDWTDANDQYKLVKVTFNSDDEITKIETPTLVSGYASDTKATLTLDGSYLYAGSSKVVKVTSNTILVKVITDDDNNTTVSFEEGLDAFSKTNKGICEITTDEDYPTQAEYIVARENGSVTSDLMFGKVTECVLNKLTADYDVTVELEDGSEEEYVSDSAITEGVVVAFVTEEDDDDVKIVVKETAKTSDVFAAIRVVDVDADGRVGYKDTDRKAVLIDLDEEDVTYSGTTYTLDDYTFAIVDVELADTYTTGTPDASDLEFGSMELVDLADLSLEENDFIGIAKTEDVIIIYRLAADLQDAASALLPDVTL